MSVLYQVTIRWIKTETNAALLVPAFDSLGRWVRLNAYSWFIWSNLTPEQISERVRAYLHPEDGLAVFSVNPGVKAGWAPEWFWRWINSEGTSGLDG